MRVDGYSWTERIRCHRDDSESVQFSYNHQPALSYLGISGLEKTDTFQLDRVSKNKVTLSKELPSGILFQRTLTLQDNYKIEFTDRGR